MARIHTQSFTWRKCNLESLYIGRKPHICGRPHSSNVRGTEQDGVKEERLKGLLCYWEAQRERFRYTFFTLWWAHRETLASSEETKRDQQRKASVGGITLTHPNRGALISVAQDRRELLSWTKQSIFLRMEKVEHTMALPVCNELVKSYLLLSLVL